MRSEIRSHTGLRGIAALLVVVYHLQFADIYKLPIETVSPFFRRCYLMVDLFFVLSGFVLCYVYYEGRALTPQERRSFWRARFARIYPLHLIALLLLTVIIFGYTALLILTGHHDAFVPGTFGDWLRQAVLLNAWFPATNDWNIPSWSISAEAFAYLLFPFAILLLKSLAGQGAILGLALAFYLLIGHSLDIVTGLAPLRCLAGFGLGMLAFIHRDRFQGGHTVVQLVGAGGILLCLVTRVADPLIIPAFVILVWATWQDRGMVSQALSSKPLHFLGEISYSVYLLHVPIGTAISVVWMRLPALFPLPLSRALFLGLNFAIVIIASHLSYRLIEKPFQSALRHKKRVLVPAL